MPTCKTPLWMLQELQDIVDESDLGRKGLAARLDVSHAQLSYWLTGREQLPLARIQAIARALGSEHGRRFLELVAGEEWVVAYRMEARDGQDLVRVGAGGMRATGRLIDHLCEALKDGEISIAEADVIFRDADDVASCVEGLKRAILAKRRGHGERDAR